MENATSVARKSNLSSMVENKRKSDKELNVVGRNGYNTQFYSGISKYIYLYTSVETQAKLDVTCVLWVPDSWR